MLRKLWLVILTIFIFFYNASAQIASNYTINGTVRDAKTGETLIGANIICVSAKNTGTLSNAYGFYAVQSTAGKVQLVASFTGYVSDTIEVALNGNIQVNFKLNAKNAFLNEVFISNKKKNENITRPLMGVEKVNMAEYAKLPVILGEKDVLKTIQLTPGFKPVGEGNAGLTVRGGNADQNLILLDEAPVYNASHVLGFFSTFNSDAIKDVSAYKGGMPAQYGGRLSSVIDIKMKDGNNQQWDFNGGVGLIASRLNISGPIKKNQGSVILSARRTYADLFTSLIRDTGQGKQVVYFYDINLKANYRLGEKDRIFLSGYFGRDFLQLGDRSGADWGNLTTTLRWNHIFGNRLFSNTSLIYSAYNYSVKIKTADITYEGKTNIIDYNFKQDFDWTINNQSKLRFGVNVIHHTVDPGSVQSSSAAGLTRPTQKRFSLESAAYVSHELKLSDNIDLVYGLRASNITVLGEGDFFEFDAAGNKTKTIRYEKGNVVTNYFNWEPRISASFQLNPTSSFKLSYNRNVQNLHLMTNTTSGSPTDVWLPSTNNIQPEIADQFAIGFYKNFNEGAYEFSSEVYYKDLMNQIEYKNGAEVLANVNVEGELLYGKGRAYGIELMLRKKTGRLTGWVAYTYSRSERQVDGLNKGQYFSARQDRPHDVTIVGMYDINKKWNFSATWLYYSGNAVTFPSGKFSINNQTVYVYTERNAYRMPDFHRLDIAFNYTPSKNLNRKYKSTWSFGLYNVYGRENPFFINFRDNKDNPTKTEAVQTSLFRFIPSVTWNFSF